MATLTETTSFPPQIFVHYDHTNKSPPLNETIKPEDGTTVTPPPTKWSYLCHPRLKEVQDEVDGYFLENWKFPSFKAVRTFLDAKFSEVTCLYFPLALDDRIHFACRLLTVLFLIDGECKRT
jgi:aristolochene synthase